MGLQRIHPILWPIQLAWAIGIFAIFLGLIGLTFVALAGEELLQSLCHTGILKR